MRLPFNILVIKTFCWDQDQIYDLPVVSHGKKMVHVGYLEHRSPSTLKQSCESWQPSTMTTVT